MSRAEGRRRRQAELIADFAHCPVKPWGWEKQPEEQRVVDALAHTHGRHPVSWPAGDRDLFDSLPDRWRLLMRSPAGRGQDPALDGLGPTSVNTWLMKVGATSPGHERVASFVLGAKDAKPRYLHDLGDARQIEATFKEAMRRVARLRALADSASAVTDSESSPAAGHPPVTVSA